MATIKSLEEKAKAYDDLLVKLQEAKVDNNVCDDRYCCVIDVIVPELKESEDERMIRYFKDLAPFDKAKELYEKYGFSHKDAIAWLEKQGEHAKFRDSIQVGDKVTRNEDGVLVNLSQLKRVAKPAEVQGEQKPDDKVEPKFKVKYAGNEYNVLEVKDIAGVIFYGIEDEPNHIDYVQAENCEKVGGYSIPTKPVVFSEQNSAWSEEDEKILSDIIKDLVHPWNEYIPDRIEEEIKWLKNKLKSLRHQSQWKPSDEQIYELTKAVDYYTSHGFPNKILNELLKQLKNL